LEAKAKATPYTLQQNSVVKHFNKTVIKAIRPMLHHKNNFKYWAKPINTMTYLNARSLHKVVKGMTSEEAWNKKKSIANHLRNFGYDA
jgi:hypothetical protein